MARCGIHKNEPYFDDTEKSTIAALAEWVTHSDKTITFKYFMFFASARLGG